MKTVHSKANSIETAVNADLVELGKNIQKQREFLGMSQESLGLDIGSDGEGV